MAQLHTTINGEPITAEVDPALSLAEFLREKMYLTGTKIGCGKGECGACTVILDGKAVTSCIIPVLRARGRLRRDHRRPGAGRQAPPPSGGVCEQGRGPVRILHPGHDHVLQGSAGRQPGPLEGGDPRGLGRKRLPLHRLCKHRTGGRSRCRPHEEGRGLSVRYVGKDIPRNDGFDKVTGPGRVYV